MHLWESGIAQSTFGCVAPNTAHFLKNEISGFLSLALTSVTLAQTKGMNVIANWLLGLFLNDFPEEFYIIFEKTEMQKSHLCHL